MSNFWMFLAGIRFFLYGMGQLEILLRQLPGRSFKLFIKKNTGNLFKSILASSVVTAIVQSSSIVSLITLSFVEAGFMPFRNALGVILGANLGTTMTSWIIALVGFKFELMDYTLPVIAVSAIGAFLAEQHARLRTVFQICFQIGILFIGIQFMKNGALDLAKNFDLNAISGYGIWIYVLTGFIMTTIIQSSSATVAIGLTAIYSGVLDFSSAAGLVIGSEVGTTVKTLLWSLSGSEDKRKVGWSNFIFNIFTGILAYIFIGWFDREVHLRIADPLIALVSFQTLINLVSIIIFIPFAGLFSRWIEKLITAGGEHTSSLTASLPKHAELAGDAIHGEARNLLKRSLRFCHLVLCSEQSTVREQKDALDIEYKLLKKSEGDLNNYYFNITQLKVNPKDHQEMIQSLSVVRRCIYAVKSVKGIQHNLEDFESSPDDLMYGQIDLIRNMWNSFETELTELLSVLDEQKLQQETEKLLSGRFQWNEEKKNELLKALHDKRLSELNASTLLNVYRALLSAKKSLIQAVSELNGQMIRE